MELFDLNPQKHPALANQAKETAMQLDQIASRLKGQKVVFFDELQALSHRFHIAAEKGIGLAHVPLDEAEKVRIQAGKHFIQRGYGTASRKPKVAGQVFCKQQARLQRLKERGNLVRPFRTIWNVPGIVRSQGNEGDIASVEHVCDVSPAFPVTLLRIANEQREKLVRQGIWDTSLPCPANMSLTPLAVASNRYARDKLAMDTGSHTESPELLALRIKVFEQRFHLNAKAQDFR